MARAESTPTTARTRARLTLGHSDIALFAIGLGCMGMWQFYSPADTDDSIGTIHAANDVGVDFFDTSGMYGASGQATGRAQTGFEHNEELIGRAISRRRDRVVIETKFGTRPSPAGGVELVGPDR